MAPRLAAVERSGRAQTLLHDRWLACSAVLLDAPFRILLEGLMGLRAVYATLSFSFGSFLFCRRLILGIFTFSHKAA
jgi:hypothetical protein